MFKRIALLLCLTAAFSSQADVQKFEFAGLSAGVTPTNFHGVIIGEGKPGEWKIVQDEVASPLTTISKRAVNSNFHPVLAQLSRDTTDEHFPICLYDGDEYGDFTFSVRIKTMAGEAEQQAGVVFRYKDEKNYYLVRANTKDGNFRFYKRVNGERGPLIGPSMPIAPGVWHDLKVTCKGNQIHVWLDGAEPFPMLMDSSFTSGKVGFCTKSDAVSYFTDAFVDYTPRLPFVKTLLDDTLKQYPRLLGLKVYAASGNTNELKVVASTDPKELGQAGEKSESDIFQRGNVYTSKGIGAMQVLMPLHDRNGEIVGVAVFEMRTFAGQTEQNAISRALPIIKGMELKIRSVKDLAE